MAKLTSLFHLNPHFSSLKESDRETVIKRCYWPLLKLAKDYGVKLSLECPADGLQVIANLDPDWLAELKKLVQQGQIEFIGSGLVQVIGPLIPRPALIKNLELGQQFYDELLGFKPTIALVNEQALNSAVIYAYQKVGFKAIIMDRAVIAAAHEEMILDQPDQPIRIKGLASDAFAPLPVLWNDSQVFQQFQRYVHHESSLEFYLNKIETYMDKTTIHLPLYGSDAEIFGFRPQRYDHEYTDLVDEEWPRIIALYKALDSKTELHFGHYQDLYDAFPKDDAPAIQLETAAHPVMVKKQRKYNITRWAVSGRVDLSLNLLCMRYYDALMAKEEEATDQDWMDLLDLWRSDYRTHIEAQRWNGLMDRVKHLKEKRPSLWWQALALNPPNSSHQSLQSRYGIFKVEAESGFLNIVSPAGALRLNTRRGLAIDGFSPDLDAISAWQQFKPYPRWLATLYHGHFNTVDHAADFYSGHLVFCPPGQAKITDLAPVKPHITLNENGELVIYASITTQYGVIYKQLVLSPDCPKIKINWECPFLLERIGSLRFGYATLRLDEPQTLFDPETLILEAKDYPKLSLSEHHDFDHGEAISHQVSAHQGIASPHGQFAFKDHYGHRLILSNDPKNAPSILMLSKKTIQNQMFIRAWFSAQEVDDTSQSKATDLKNLPSPSLGVSFEISKT